ncbi:uncharacterized protein LOC114272882 isoform X3 [Camellia sinensis]|uniref:uncharacterized protein LOC114272882 isoform X3 n=1 Tax=Camellia sinensis TaxID=4442 RepID=UPI001035BEB3|nr:uncharacterized protein LOC114272882 isoform X3 [Camellia sinensis]
MSVHMHMQRPQASKPPNILMGGLDLLADVLKNEWDKQQKHWNGPWTAAFQSGFMIPKLRKNKHDDFETIIQLTRNLMSHHNNHDFYLYGKQWNYRKDLYIHFMNRTHNLRVALFDTIQTVQKKFERGLSRSDGFGLCECGAIYSLRVFGLCGMLISFLVLFNPFMRTSHLESMKKEREGVRATYILRSLLNFDFAVHCG